MAHTKRGMDPAADFLEDAGEIMRGGNFLQTKVKATDLADSSPQVSRQASSAAARSGKINIRKVAEVLESYGMDPTEEILKVAGELDADTKARVMLGLLEYVHPKLARSDHTVTGADGGPIQNNLTIEFVGAKRG